MKDYNSMCRDCRYLGTLCSGTHNPIYSGCIWKDADPAAVEQFGRAIDKAIGEGAAE